MRALIDTNVFISYLLIRSGGRIPTIIVESALSQRFSLLLSERIVIELSRRVGTKPYLAQRISSEDIREFFDAVRDVAERIPELVDGIPEICRDQKDDYLLAHAVVERPDYLVSGDKDLQDLGEIDGIPIVSPAEFVQILEERGIIQRDQRRSSP